MVITSPLDLNRKTTLGVYESEYLLICEENKEEVWITELLSTFIITYF
jgi:hypothetical protein